MNYLVIEGNIGAGKTSLAKKLSEEMNAKLILEEFAENPFLPKFYADPGKYSFPLELSFLADRYKQLKEKLTYRDIFHPFVIADYYFSKSLVFASITLPDDELSLYQRLYSIIHQQLPVPDLYLYLHLPVERLLQNIATRGRDYESTIQTDYLKRLQEGYFKYMKSQEKMKILVVDVQNSDFIHSEEDYLKLKKIIFKKNINFGLNHVIL